MRIFFASSSLHSTPYTLHPTPRLAYYLYPPYQTIHLKSITTMKKILLLALTLALASLASEAKACTGITLHTTANQPITARTIEWAARPLNLMYVIVPREHQHKSFLPDNTTKGMRYSSKFGYVGIAVEDKAYVMEGINEAGLAAGLFYFPDYGKYMPFDPNQKDITISDMHFVSWMLASFSSIDELVEQIDGIRVVGVDPRASTVHWRVTEPSGRQIVIEIINEHINIHENPSDTFFRSFFRHIVYLLQVCRGFRCFG